MAPPYGLHIAIRLEHPLLRSRHAAAAHSDHLALQKIGRTDRQCCQRNLPKCPTPATRNFCSTSICRIIKWCNDPKPRFILFNRIKFSREAGPVVMTFIIGVKSYMRVVNRSTLSCCVEIVAGCNSHDHSVSWKKFKF